MRPPPNTRYPSRVFVLACACVWSFSEASIVSYVRIAANGEAVVVVGAAARAIRIVAVAIVVA